MNTPANTSKSPLITSGTHLSYWTDSVEPLKFSPLQNAITADVVVVGAGISGMSVAYNLAKSGKEVIVLEDGYVGSGETGRTTAHLVNAFSVEDIRTGFLKIISDAEYREGLIQNGFRNCMRFSQRTIANQFVDLYKRIGVN